MSTDPESVAMAISNDAAEAVVAEVLASALRKLEQHEDPFRSALLPDSVIDPVWNLLYTKYSLSVEELMALKKHTRAAPFRPRGVLPRIEGEGTIYKPNDARVRARLTISNVPENQTIRYTMEAELLVDSGANTELKLPARKILQLQLRPYGRPFACRSSTNDILQAQMFTPVRVQVTLTRDGVEETIEAYLGVKCDKAEYDEAVAAGDAALGNSGGSDPFVTPSSVAQASLSTPAPSPAGNRMPITEISISPVKHRPRDAPLQQAVIGMEGMKKLHLHLNSKQQRLEIEEDEVLEDGEW